MKIPSDRIAKNPFTVITPEFMTARQAVDLFVDVFTDFPKINRPEHVFLHGSRGSGKSMIFRFLEPDCQMIHGNCTIEKLDYYSIYVPIKQTDLKLTELLRLDNKHASGILNEHFMIIFIILSFFDGFSKIDIAENNIYLKSLKSFSCDVFIKLLKQSGWTSSNKNENAIKNVKSIRECKDLLISISRELYNEYLHYLRRLSLTDKTEPYNGPLCGYIDLLYVLLMEFKKLPFISNKPIYLLIDDADNLNETQTMILNSWVASRTTENVSLKISTQLRYKTYLTITGNLIDTPHDFSEINISNRYTRSFKDNYKPRLKEIVQKRLKLAGITKNPDEFFPADEHQERRIKEIEQSYIDNWEESGRGNRPRDDAYRYARPDYMKSLSGSKKSRKSYKYAGFDQLADISSGVIRYFLEAAAQMYNDTFEQSANHVNKISPQKQNDVIRSLSDRFILDQFNKTTDMNNDYPYSEDNRKLGNLINCLGGTFNHILLNTDKSERRVFSIAFSNVPDYEVSRIMNLGVQLGFFHTGVIGNKEGTGRTRLYILVRMLAPFFYLDPTNFSGYLFVTNDAIKEAMQKPDQIIRRIKKEGVDKIFEQRQLKLFDDGD